MITLWAFLNHNCLVQQLFMSGNAARELRRVAGNLNYIWNISIFTKICWGKSSNYGNYSHLCFLLAITSILEHNFFKIQSKLTGFSRRSAAEIFRSSRLLNSVSFSIPRTLYYKRSEFLDVLSDLNGFPSILYAFFLDFFIIH